MRYSAVDLDVVKILQDITGSKNVIFGDQDGLIAYSHDEVAESKYHHFPEVVVKPGTAAEIAAIMKMANGYNLLHLLVGSEGTLGIFTQITLKLLPLPRYKADLLALFRDIHLAMAMVPEIITKARIVPTAVEFMDRLSLETSCRYLNENLTIAGAGAALLIEVDGKHREQNEDDCYTIGERCKAGGALEVFIADNATTMERVWKIRRNIAEAFKVYSPVQSLEDIVVPVSAVAIMVKKIEQISQKYGCLIPCYGHAGDGNLHVTPIKDPSLTDNEWELILDRILNEMFTAACELGGTISGEHGIGSKRLKYLPLALTNEERALMKRIKAAFDPNNILNPGKIIELAMNE